MQDTFSYGAKWDYRNVTFFTLLLILPNFLGMVNLATPWGFKIHFFQVAIFLAALLYGPKGGLFSGLIGSLYSGLVMHNPYLVVGNAILGFFVGLFARYGLSTLFSVLLAFAIQLPWLILTDYYLVGLSYTFISGLVVALAISNTIWALAAHYIAKQLR